MAKLIRFVIPFLLIPLFVWADVDTFDGTAITTSTDIEGTTGWGDVCGQTGTGGGACSGAVYGQDSYSGGCATPPVAYEAYLTQITMDCSDTGGDICAVLDDFNNSDQEVLLILYDDSGGEPNNLLASVLVTSSSSSPVETCEAYTASISSGNYWVGVLFESTSNQYCYESSSGGTGRYDVIGSFEAPATWDTGGDSNSNFDRAFWLSQD